MYVHRGGGKDTLLSVRISAGAAEGRSTAGRGRGWIQGWDLSGACSREERGQGQDGTRGEA